MMKTPDDLKVISGQFGWVKKTQIQVLEFTNFIHNTFRDRLNRSLGAVQQPNHQTANEIAAMYFDSLLGTTVLIATRLMGLDMSSEDELVRVVRVKYDRIRKASISTEVKTDENDRSIATDSDGLRGEPDPQGPQSA